MTRTCQHTQNWAPPRATRGEARNDKANPDGLALKNGGQGQNRTVDTRIFNPRHCHIPPWPRERKVTGFPDFTSLPPRPPNPPPNQTGLFGLARVEYRTGSTQCVCRRRSWTDLSMPTLRTGTEPGGSGCLHTGVSNVPARSFWDFGPMAAMSDRRRW